MTATGRWQRLNPMDAMFLRLEKPDWPCHYGVLLTLDGTPWMDADGSLPLADLTTRIERRLAGVPRLRRRLLDPGPLLGRPLWVDDPQFDIHAQVRRAQVPAPGGDAELLAAALGAYDTLLDSSRPLWELWFLTGATAGRVGVLLKLHHTVADGLAAVELAGALTDATPDAPDPGSTVWTPAPPPTKRALARDRIAGLTAGARATAESARAALRERREQPRADVGRSPINLLRTLRGFAGSGGAAASALNAPVRAGRRVASVEMDLAFVKTVAHAHGGTVNDVALALWAGGLRALLASRGLPLTGVEVAAGQTVTLRGAGTTASLDNQVGSVMLRLPVWEANPARRLALVVERTRAAKASQRPAAIMAVLAALAATPFGRVYSAHQRAGNVICTNVRGPTATRYLLGAPILSVLPIIELVGNIALTQIAYSYAGQILLATTADATAFSDLDVLVDGMADEWAALIAGLDPGGVHA